MVNGQADVITTAEAWGSFSQERQAGRQRNELRVDHGRLRLNELSLGVAAVPTSIALRAGGKPVTVKPQTGASQVRLALAQELVLPAGETLVIELR